MTEPAKIDDDPLGIFAMSDAAADADARKLLRRAGHFEWTPQQLEDAKESARLQYAAAARDAIRTGKVRT